MKSPNFRRRVTIGACIAAVALIVPTIAAAVVIDLPYEATYTGCLKSDGSITKVAPGNSPKSECPNGAKVMHISGGDITAVNSGAGLAGGWASGDVTLSLASSYRLPQGCTNGSVARTNGTTWSCSTDFGGTHSSTIGLGDVVAAGPTEDCVDGDTFTGQTTAGGNTLNLNFVLPAGKWRPATTGSTRWFVNKTADVFDGERFAGGYVKMEILKGAGANPPAVSTWARAESENLDGGGLPYNQDFSSFTTDGTARVALKATAVGFACSTARLLAPTIEFDRVG